MSVFVDSTTLLYSLDENEPAKREMSLAWLRALRRTRELVLSPQVLNETYSVVFRKRGFAPARGKIRHVLREYFGWVRAGATAETLATAWDIQDRYRTSFWDALLLASASETACAYFLSEDLNDGQLIGEVRILNPFRHDPPTGRGQILN